MGKTARYLIKAGCGLYGTILVLASAPTHATIPLADSPLFLTVAVPPNITLTLDDSGSMRRAFVPENCLTDTSDCDHLDNRYEKSAHRNLIHYNPNVKYPAPKNAAGASLTTSFTSAYRNGFDPTSGTPINLGTNYRPSASLNLSSGSTTEQYMGHFPSEVRCNSGSGTRYCQYRTGPSTWVNTTTVCSSITGGASPFTEQQRRDNFCRGTHDTQPDGRLLTNPTTQIQGTPAGVPAYYYVFKTANIGCTGSAAQKAVDNDCYDITYVSSTSGPGTLDLNGDGAISGAGGADSDERQNFANWYSFARTRNLATQTAASLAFVDLDPTVRVAWQALNSCKGSATNFVDTDCDGWKNNFTGVSNAIRPFTGTHRSNFYSWIFQQPTNDSTPLPAAMQRVGEYYATTGENSPYDDDFGTSNSGELACRRNYHILMTDGIWNLGVNVGHKDGAESGTATVALPEAQDGITEYTSRAPYQDTQPSTLADVAFDYWIRDLRNTLDNNLLPLKKETTTDKVADFWNPRNDPATWQHMVNFTIGLGLTGYLPAAGLTWDGNMYGGSYPNIANGIVPWPAASSTTNNAANVSDLWHAAINSRGKFFSADDPASLSVAFRAALTAITGDSGSAAALSANSTSLTGSTLVYQARFNKDWSGTLLALPVEAGGVVGAHKWDASKLIPAHGSRKIFTHNGSAGVEFSSCTNLSVSQKAALDTNSGGVVDNRCDARLQWLRGNPKDEVRSVSAGSLKLFRNRLDTVMGDIVNSDPAFVKDVNYGYTGLPAGTPGQSSYDSFRSGNSGRLPMVYVGANDGKMYGFRGDVDQADSGVEKFSYIPGGVYPNLSHLTDPSYSHRYYVDGGITVGDAYFGGGWKTVLLGGLNAGGKTIYALDVTNPAAFDASKVLWEFDAGDDAADLGLTYSRPQIGILESGQWVAIFGNGYNSTDGGAHLYVVNLETGALIRKITALDPAGDESNGLSTPILFDADEDKLIDTVYAGDLRGNLWKFDLSAAASASWSVAYGAPLFKARNGDNDEQPITAQPKVVKHQFGGQLIVFGTGRYITNGDVFEDSVQTYYGIQDKGSAISTTNRSELQAQRFDLQTTKFGRKVRSVTNNTVDWTGGKRGWYLDLLDGPAVLDGPSGPPRGERVVHTSIIAAGRAIFGSIVPSTDPCEPGGTSWLIELKLGTGGAFSKSVLDLNDDGLFDQSDTANDEVINAVSNDGLGISNVPVWIEDEDMAYKVRTGTTGNFATEKNCLKENEEECGSGPPPSPGGVTRRSWIQIR